jgi:hypothetical protein
MKPQLEGATGSCWTPHQKGDPAFAGDCGDRSQQLTRTKAQRGKQKGHSCKRLPIQFRRSGFNYRQIAREGDVAIYEQIWAGRESQSVSYEIIRVRRHDGYQIKGTFIPPAEIYPKSESWGVDGFTLTERDAAFAKLEEIA